MLYATVSVSLIIIIIILFPSSTISCRQTLDTAKVYAWLQIFYQNSTKKESTYIFACVCDKAILYIAGLEDVISECSLQDDTDQLTKVHNRARYEIPLYHTSDYQCY